MPHVTLRRRAAATTAAAVLTALTLAGPAAATTAPAGHAPSPYVLVQGSATDAGAQGIIMSDGNICNPRWGC